MISEPLVKKRVSRAAKSYVMRVDAVACLRSGAAVGCCGLSPGSGGGLAAAATKEVEVLVLVLQRGGGRWIGCELRGFWGFSSGDGVRWCSDGLLTAFLFLPGALRCACAQLAPMLCS